MLAPCCPRRGTILKNARPDRLRLVFSAREVFDLMDRSLPYLNKQASAVLAREVTRLPKGHLRHQAHELVASLFQLLRYAARATQRSDVSRGRISGLHGACLPDHQSHGPNGRVRSRSAAPTSASVYRNGAHHVQRGHWRGSASGGGACAIDPTRRTGSTV